MKNHRTKDRNQYQENEKSGYQEPKPGTLFLVGSWLRPEDFGFGRTLLQGMVGRGEGDIHP